MADLKWKSVSGYIIGRSHVLYDEPCQDRAIHFDNGSVKGIVVSDGAGSCKYSELGAIAVTNAIAAVTSEQFTEWYKAVDTAQLMEQYVLSELHKLQAQYENSTLIDFSATLLAVIVNGNEYLAAHVGDGVICQRINSDISVLSHPENGRYSNETYFVTMTPLNDHFRVYKGKITAPHDFIAMTDGAAISFYINAKKEMELTNTATLFEHLTENEAADVQAELPDFLKLLQKNTSDDCAVAILVSHDVNDLQPSQDHAGMDESPADFVAANDDHNLDDNLYSDEDYKDDYDDYDDEDYDDYEDDYEFDDFDDDFETVQSLESNNDQVLPRQTQQSLEKASSQQNKIDSFKEASGEEGSQSKAQQKACEKSEKIYVHLNDKVKTTNIFKLLPRDRRE